MHSEVYKYHCGVDILIKKKNNIFLFIDMYHRYLFYYIYIYLLCGYLPMLLLLKRIE